VLGQVEHQHAIEGSAPKRETPGIRLANGHDQPCFAAVSHKTPSDLNRDGRKIHPEGSCPQPGTMAQDFATTTADIKHRHPGPDIGHLKGLAQPTGKLRSVAGDKLFVPFTRT
jgi:hypothetical protein